MKYIENKSPRGKQVYCYKNKGHWYAIAPSIIQRYSYGWDCSDFNSIPREERSFIINDLLGIYDFGPILLDGFTNWVTDSDQYLTINDSDDVGTKDFTMIKSSL